jgi:general L-amino acid transport system permease protein
VTDTQPSLHAAATAKPPFYRDATVVKWLVQIVALAGVLFAAIFLAREAGAGLEAKSIQTGFGFLAVDPDIALGEGIDTDPATGGRALWVGMVNTIRMAVAGIFLATILGTLIGIGRLSSNWLVAKLASAFIEYMRNIPLLVHIILFFVTIATVFPGFGGDVDPVTGEVTQGPIPGVLHISNKGISIPRLHIGDGFYQWLIIVVIGLVAARWVAKKRHEVQDQTGQLTYPVLSALGVLLVFAVVGWFIHPMFGWVGDAIFAPIRDLIDGMPEALVQVLLTIAAVAIATWWIWRFFDARRTPGGSAKLTDDDWFRVIFAGVMAAVAAFVFLVLWPGLSIWLINSGSDLFDVLANKFGDGRGSVIDDPPIDVGMPDVEKLGSFANMGPSGLNLTQGFAAVFFGIVLYTAAFIAEIVRGGILAVPKGQTEAAQAIGLRRSTMMRRIILPQAARVSLPPLGNQYLNLTKNTSLAIAVGYTDVVQVGQTIFNQTGRSLEVFIIWMLFYLACSLTISVVVNFFNVRLKIVER